jgi:pimeloyl-ACP methyl ester carboxylesterase
MCPPRHAKVPESPDWEPEQLVAGSSAPRLAAVVQTLDLQLSDGRRLVVHDAGEPLGGARLAAVWHHGSPQSGRLLAPLLEAAGPRGVRLLSFGRASYGGSSPNPGRDIAAVGRDVVALADALGLERLAVLGASGGGPHAMAAAAALPDRVVGVATFASPAPFTTEIDWFDGMASPDALHAAQAGRQARATFAETETFDPTQFIAADWTALAGPWQSLGADAEAEGAASSDGLIDDDVAIATPWGFDLGEVRQPVLLVHGGLDRVIPPSHADLLLRRLPNAELWLRPRDGHVSVLTSLPVAMDWLLAIEAGSSPG